MHIFIFLLLDRSPYLGPVYMEKSCSGKEGHPPSRVNFSERWYEKKVDPFARANSARACSDCLALTELTPLGESVVTWRKVGPARRVTHSAEPTFFVSRVNGSPIFVRKCRKCWLAQGSSGRRVTLLPGTTFLHINGALVGNRNIDTENVYCYWNWMNRKMM